MATAQAVGAMPRPNPNIKYKTAEEMKLVPPEVYMNCMDQYTALTSECFYKEWGTEWNTARMAMKSGLDFSGPEYLLETLVGPDGGLMHFDLKRQHLQSLNMSKNKIVDIDILSSRNEKGKLEFPSLRILNAAWNNIANIKLVSESLTELNLSHNDFERFPTCFDQIPQLQKLFIGQNRMDGSIFELSKNVKLRVLDISANRFSWKPTEFKRMLDGLKNLHLEEMRVWPNPFAENFKEYQVLTLTYLDALRSIDYWEVDDEVKSQLRHRAEQIRIDFSVFDVQVQVRSVKNAPAKDNDAVGGVAVVPYLHELLNAMDQALDNPSDLVTQVYEFEELVLRVWRAPFFDRRQLMQVPSEGPDGGYRRMSPSEEVNICAEFADKMEQLLSRFESVRDCLIQCLVRLLACGWDTLGCRCAHILAEWVDANAGALHRNVDDVSMMLFRELRLRTLGGLQSIHESPLMCYQTTHNMDREASKQYNWGRHEEVAETASIFNSLSRFGKPASYVTQESPLRARVLRLFLPALCREPRSMLGEDQDRSTWQAYKDFDAFPVRDVKRVAYMDLKNIADPEESMETITCPTASFETSLITFQQKCVRQDYGGFVTMEHPYQPDETIVFFKKQRPGGLVGMRCCYQGRTLHVRPAQQVPLFSSPKTDKLLTWDAWTHGLAVLVAATSDPDNAARAITLYKAHEAVAKFCPEQSDTGFSEGWLRVTPEAIDAYNLWLQLAQNLIGAKGKAGQVCHELFYKAKLHVICWNRMARGLAEAGTTADGFSLAALSKTQPRMCSMIFTCVNAVARMGTGPPAGAPHEVREAVMQEVYDTDIEAFNVLLEIAAHTGIPDPLLLAAGLEAIYMFLENDLTRTKLLADVLGRLHNTSVLLPYIRGPVYNGSNNPKYMELWRMCELKYAHSENGWQRLIDAGDVWHKRVPSLKDAQNPLLHRVLLGVVKIIELCSNMAQSDATGLLSNVTNVLNDEHREEMLVSPVGGLVNCSDFDVRIQCLKCVKHVLNFMPSQFSPEEMGWILRYLSPYGLGVARQDEFLMELTRLVIMFIQQDNKIGVLFRGPSGLAKTAIRESFNILIANCSRDKCQSDVEERDRVRLNSSLVELLANCSRPLSEDLRQYMRKGDLALYLRQVMILLDRDDEDGCRAELLSTYTGRDMQEVLMPLATSFLRVDGRSRLCVMIRLADVLQGKPDYKATTEGQDEFVFEADPASDERNLWLGRSVVHASHARQDRVEAEDQHEQQEEFFDCGGYDAVYDSLERLFCTPENDKHYRRARSLFEDVFTKAEEKVKTWYPSTGAITEGETTPALQVVEGAPALPASSGQSPQLPPQDSSDVVNSTGESTEDSTHTVKTMFTNRLKVINERVNNLFGYNLNLRDGQTGGSTLQALAEIIAEYFQANQRINDAYKEVDAEAYTELTSPEHGNKVHYEGKLVNVSLLREKNLVYEKARQKTHDLDHLFRDAEVAYFKLKDTFIVKQGKTTSDDEVNQAKEWATMPAAQADGQRRVSKGLIEFFAKFGVSLVDPGMKSRETVQSKLTYKYFKDITRIRDVVRFTAEFRTLADLRDCINELLTNNRLNVVKIRNRFLFPSGLGRRHMQLTLEVPLDRGSHLCEVRFVVSTDSKTDPESLRRAFLHKLESCLGQRCQIKPNDQRHVSNFMLCQLESRAVCDGDVITLNGPHGQWLEAVRGEAVTHRTDTDPDQHFVIERVKGLGPVKVYDVVRLRSRKDDKYLDVSTVGKVQCRYDSTELDMSNTRFVVECGQPGLAHGGEGLLSWMGAGNASNQNDGFGIAEGRRKTSTAVMHSTRNVNTGMKLRLQAFGTNRYLTANPGGHYLSYQHATYVKARKATEALEQSQVFTVWRWGTVAEQLRVHPVDHAQHWKWNNESKTLDFRRLLMTSCMCAVLPTPDQNCGDGGPLGTTSAGLRAVVRQQAGKNVVRAVDNVPAMDYGGCWDPPTVVPQTTAAYLRMFYSVMEYPATPSIRNKVLDLIQGLPDEDTLSDMKTLTRMLTIVTAAQYIAGSQLVDSGEDGALDLVSAWLPAKALRLLASALVLLPLRGEPAHHRRYNPEFASDRAALAKHKSLMDSGVFDRQRLVMFEIVAFYMRTVLTPPLVRRLLISRQHDLSLKEVVLLREYAKCVECILRKLLGNEMRSVNTEEIPNEQMEDRRQKHRQRLFEEMISPSLVRVLVQAFLYGIHREASLHRPDPRVASIGEAERKPAKSVASLIDRCISALSMVMYFRHGAEVNYEYEICEAISQAITDGSQLVPKARVAQLMSERSAERLRLVVQGMFDYEKIIHPNPAVEDARNTQVVFLGWAWMGNTKDRDLRRRLIVVTSRMLMAVIDVPQENAVEPTWENCECASVRELTEVDHSIVNPRMRQFIGLKWRGGRDRNQSIQVLIFESGRRNRAFREVLRLVPLSNPHAPSTGQAVPQGSRGPPEVVVHKGVRDTFAIACTIAAPTSVVSTTFIRPDEPKIGFKKQGVEALILSRDSICVVDMSKIMYAFQLYADYDAILEIPEAERNKDMHEDSDSDQEGLTNHTDEIVHQDTPYLEHTRGKRAPHPLNTLKGVWFLADSEPKLRMQFGADQLSVSFFSDGERQRFRQQLACTLTGRRPKESGAQNAADDDEELGKRWTVTPTHDESTMDEVSKAVKQRWKEVKQSAMAGRSWSPNSLDVAGTRGGS